jgi:hypothetical protein
MCLMMYASFATGADPLDRAGHDRPAGQRDRDRPRPADGGRHDHPCPTAAELRSEALDRLRPENGPADGRAAFLARVADNARATAGARGGAGRAAEAEAVARLQRLLGVDGDFER